MYPGYRPHLPPPPLYTELPLNPNHRAGLKLHPLYTQALVSSEIRSYVTVLVYCNFQTVMGILCASTHSQPCTKLSFYHQHNILFLQVIRTCQLHTILNLCYYSNL